jgi:hypothetical protein
LLLLAFVATQSAQASDRVFECKDAKGRTTYTNVPCEGQAIKPESLEASAYTTPYGEWLGQIQFRVTTGKGGAAHSVSPLTIKIESGGRLTGASQETGCRLLGIGIPTATAYALSLDVTMSDCKEQAFSRHYNGTLALYPAPKYTQLTLISPPHIGQQPLATYDLTGIMRR